MMALSSFNVLRISDYGHPLLAVVIVAVCAKILYSAIYHPLAKYPGPFWAKFTNLYAAYHAFNEDIHLDILRCHRKYGKFVRYGPNRLLVDSTQGLQDIYSHNKNVQKATAYLPMVPDGTGWTTMTAIDKTAHSTRRKLVSKMMSADSLAVYERQLIRHLDHLCTNLSPALSESWSTPRMMSDSCQELTTKAISEFLFGVPIDNPYCATVINALRNYSWRMGVYIQCPSLTKLHAEGIAELVGYGKELRKEFQAWVEGYGQSALDNKQGRFKVFQDASFKDRDAEKAQATWTSDELWAEGFFLTWAGSDTSSTTISALLFYLAHNPSAYRQLAAEIRSTFSSAGQIVSGPELNSCAYLSACVRETLRCCPSTPGAPWREVCKGGIMIDDHFIPAGLDVGTCIYSLQHQEAYFTDAHRWVPQRWLVGKSSGDQPGQREKWSMSPEAHDAVNPFSIGPRSCVGKSMAYLQIGLVVARLVWEFDFRLPQGEEGSIGEGGPGRGKGRERRDEYQLKANVTSQSHGPLLEFRRRPIVP